MGETRGRAQRWFDRRAESYEELGRFVRGSGLSTVQLERLNGGGCAIAPGAR
jgi:hypothetical protein